MITSSYPIKSSFELVQYIGSLQSLTKIKLDQLDKLQMKLRSEGGIKALLGMVRCRHADVLAQVARGIANFAKCESRAATQGEKLIKAPSWCSCCSACHVMHKTIIFILKNCFLSFVVFLTKLPVYISLKLYHLHSSWYFHEPSVFKSSCFLSLDSFFNGIGTKTGRSLLIEDGALPWIVQNANNEASPIRRHIELALCHLAQHGMLPSLVLVQVEFP